MFYPGKACLNSLLLDKINVLDFDVLFRVIVGVGVDFFDLSDNVHAVRYFAEVGVFPIEERCGFGGNDEELRAIGIWSRVCHGNGSFDKFV